MSLFGKDDLPRVSDDELDDGLDLDALEAELEALTAELELMEDAAVSRQTRLVVIPLSGQRSLQLWRDARGRLPVRQVALGDVSAASARPSDTDAAPASPSDTDAAPGARSRTMGSAVTD